MFPYLSLRHCRTSCPQKLSFSMDSHVCNKCATVSLYSQSLTKCRLAKDTSAATLASTFSHSTGAPLGSLETDSRAELHTRLRVCLPSARVQITLRFSRDSCLGCLTPVSTAYWRSDLGQAVHHFSSPPVFPHLQRKQ